MSDLQSNIKDGFSQIGDATASLKELIHRHICDGDACNDMEYVRHVVRSYEEVEKYEEALEKLQEVLEGCCAEFGRAVRETAGVSNGTRLIELEITQGMINQKYVSLTTAKKQGLVRVGEKFRIDTGEGGVVETTLVNPGNKFQNRSFVQSFFDRTRAREGDSIVLQELEKGIWRMFLKRKEELADEMLKSLGIELAEPERSVA